MGSSILLSVWHAEFVWPDDFEYIMQKLVVDK
jgi:hypothetical protein